MGVKIGDKNKIKNSTIIGGHQINASRSSSEAKRESFWRRVFQNIVANIIWWIIGLIALAIAGVATLNWDAIIELITR